MTTLYAQPYDLAASGFYFDSEKAYASQASRLRNAYGQPVEEFEIQFIDGETLDAQLFDSLHISRATIGDYFEAVEAWDDHQKLKTIIAVGEVGYSFNLGSDDPDKFDIDLYEVESLRDLAVRFVDEGLFGDIPKSIENYLDYDAIARDLGMDYGTVIIDGTRYAYRAT
jgi:antirestriction protein